MTNLADREDLRDAAKKHVARKTGADVDDLEISSESVGEYDIIDEKYYEAKILNRADNGCYGAFLDADGDPVDRDSVRERARNAREEKYGKLSSGLYETVNQMDRNESVEIAVWTNIDRAAAKKAATTQESSTVAEQKQAVSEEIRKRASNAADRFAAKLSDIEQVEIREVSAALPLIDATATPRAIEQINQLDEVWAIFNDEGTFVEDLGSASNDTRSRKIVLNNETKARREAHVVVEGRGERLLDESFPVEADEQTVVAVEFPGEGTYPVAVETDVRGEQDVVIDKRHGDVSAYIHRNEISVGQWADD